MRGTVAANVVAGEPWGLRIAPFPGAAFHAVTAGTVDLIVAGHPVVRLMPGDAVLLSTGAGHVLTNGAGTDPEPFDGDRAAAALDAGTELAVGPPPGTTRILCAAYAQDPAATIGPFSLLPEIVHVRAASAPAPLRSTLLLLADELRDPAPGSRAVLDHVVSILLVQVLRAWIAGTHDPDRPASWLRGLGEPISRAALAEIHHDPARQWTLETLARAIGVSRATLVRRFTTEVGQTPADYLTSWRLALAARRLRDGDDSVAAIARAVGYVSEYAFNRAFARRHGQPPGRYRSTHRHLDSPNPLEPQPAKEDR